MPYNTRSQKNKIQKLEENNSSLDEIDKEIVDEEEDNEENLLDYEENGVNRHEKITTHRVSKKSPYSRARELLNETRGEEEQIDVHVKYRKRRLSSKSSLSTPEKIKQSKNSSESKSSLSIVLFLIILSILGLVYWSSKGSEVTHYDIIKQYKSNLLGISSKVIEAAIEEFQESSSQVDKPVVVLLNGNQTLIEEFYLKLANILINKKSSWLKQDPSQTIFHLNQLESKHDLIKNVLENKKMILINGLEKLKATDYMQLYGYVDDGDSHVSKCLIMIGLNDQVNRSEVDFKHVSSVEDYVRKKLRQNWKDIDKSNLEALLNRIVSYVGIIN